LITILDRIIEHKREELKALKRDKPLEKLKEEIEKRCYNEHFFRDALSVKEGVNIIAEVKKGSPSKGIICHDFDHVRIAREYEAAGAKAISVLTDEQFFFGSLEYLKEIKREVRLPILRKDFIIDEYQIYEARAAGADAVLLIASVLDASVISKYLILARELCMDALVEVHNQEELDKVLTTDAGIIGINNRDLTDFSVDLNTTKELSKNIPDDKIIVCESGIHTHEDIGFIVDGGVNTFLVGEALVKGGSIREKLRELQGIEIFIG